MAYKLPDEVLSDILSDSLVISDKEFVYTGSAEESPFGRRNHSTSLVLLVCKRWLRVATPLLYEVVVIRSTAQAQALGDVVKENPRFGTYIRKLRMEGGFGASPWKFISAAPNIRDLRLTLDIWSSDSVDGLYRALPMMNPRRLIVSHTRLQSNTKSRALVEQLFACIKSWISLTTFQITESCDEETVDYSLFADLLLQSSSLVKVLVPISCGITFLDRLSASKSIKAICVCYQLEDREIWAADALKRNPILPSFVVFEPDSIDLNGTLNPLIIKETNDFLPKPGYVPFQSVSLSISELLWSRIFSFATYPAHYGDIMLESPGNAWRWGMEYSGTQVAARLSLVSKSFHSIVQPHLFRAPVLRTHTAFSSFCNALEKKQGLGSLVRNLCVTARYEQSQIHHVRLTQVLRSLTELVQFIIHSDIAPEQLKLLTRTASKSLHSLIFSLKRHHVVDIGTLGSLMSMEVTLWMPITLKGQLPALRTLVLDCAPALVDASMPSLAHLTLKEDIVGLRKLLEKNGGNLTKLTTYYLPNFPFMAACPRLQHLEITQNDQNFHAVMFEMPEGSHTQLSKITFTGETLYTISTEMYLKNIRTCLELVDLVKFPQLREIRFHHFKWPNSERDIKKAKTLVKLALDMKEQYNIALQDSTGAAWRPRAQVRRHL